jgi:hypothetical protein
MNIERRRVRGLVTLFGECKLFLYSLSLLILVSGDDLHRTDLCQSNDQPPNKIASPSSPSPSSLKGRSEVINPPGPKVKPATERGGSSGLVTMDKCDL